MPLNTEKNDANNAEIIPKNMPDKYFISELKIKKIPAITEKPRKISENLRWRLNYENNEVLVGTHSVTAYGEEQSSIVMFFATYK